LRRAVWAISRARIWTARVWCSSFKVCQFLKAFQERLAKFGLELNLEKTWLIEFGRFAAQDRKRRGEGKPETFTFLGFTHYCGQRRNGAFIVWRVTAKSGW
jgi:hypothetical protein